MKTIKKVAEVYTGGNEIATTIDSTSTNSEVAGAKAVYDFSPNLIKYQIVTRNTSPRN